MKLTHILRAVHRDLGFLIVGIALIYGTSGIVLNHIGDKDPAFRTEMNTIQLPVNLTDTELSAAWNADKNLPALKRVMHIDEDHFRMFLEGGVGVYSVADGRLDYEKHEKRVLIYWINRLHYNKVKGWSPIADFFAVSLILLAITGLFITKGKKGIAGSGKWYLIAGLLIPIVFVILFLR